MKIKGIKLTEKSKGRTVTYIPHHANGNIHHPDCEEGIISSWNDLYIFINYTGTPTATRPKDLVWF